MRKHPRLLLAAVALVGVIGLVAAGCGGDDDSSATPAPAEAPAEQPAESSVTSTPTLSAVPSGALAYETDTLEAAAGEVTIEFTNPSTTPHNVSVEGNGIETVFGEIVTEADAPITLTLEPGTYTFFCSVPGHRAAGMEGTLIVS